MTVVHFSYSYPSTWGSPVINFGTQDSGVGNDYEVNFLRLSKVGSRYWLILELTSNVLGIAGDVLLSVSEDGLRFSGPLHLGLDIVSGEAIDFVIEHDSITYLGGDGLVKRSAAVATVTVEQSQIIQYDLNGNGASLRLKMELDNRDGALAGLETGRLGADLILERGAVINGTARRVALPPMVVASIRWSDDFKRVMLEAYNYHELLDLWVASLGYFYEDYRVDDLVRTMAALAGIFSCTFDGASIWALTVDTFSISPGQSASRALESLMAQYQFMVRMDGSNRLECFVLGDAPTADYIINKSAPNHPSLFIRDTAERSLPDATHSLVVGDGLAAEAISSVQYESGRQHTRRLSRRYLTDPNDAQSVANSYVTKINQTVNQSAVYLLPAFQLQAFDAVSTDDWQSNQVRYIAGLSEVYRAGGAGLPWVQRLRLSGLVRSSGGAALVVPGADVQETVGVFKRATILSFDASSRFVVVQIENSASAVAIPAAQYLPAALLTAGQSVAVLLFDESNPSDGLVLGPYGATLPVMDDLDVSKVSKLYESDGDGPSWMVDAAGRLSGLGDVFPAGDKRGFVARVAGLFTYHFNDERDYIEPPSPWAWASYLDGAPPEATTITNKGYLRMSSNNVSKKHFLYRAFSGSGFRRAKVFSRIGGAVGLRVDDGTANNYIEWMLRTGSASGLYKLQTNVSGVTTDALVNMIRSEEVGLQLATSSAWPCYYSLSTLDYRGLINAGVPAWTPVNIGIFFTNSASPSDAVLVDGVTV